MYGHEKSRPFLMQNRRLIRDGKKSFYREKKEAINDILFAQILTNPTNPFKWEPVNKDP